MDENIMQILETQPSKTSAYKAVCVKLGIIMSVYFLCRIAVQFIFCLLNKLSNEVSETAIFLSGSLIQVMLIYLIPLLVAAILFKSFDYYGNGKMKELYKKPRRLARALGSFPAMYGLGYGTALITNLISALVVYITMKMGSFNIEEFNPLTIKPSDNLISALTMVFLLVIIAPVFEEILYRGIIYDALKPFGAGIAIIISSVLFGFAHGNILMLFYTTALGFALGYVRYATNSLFVVTILHMLINGVAALNYFLMSLAEINNYENKMVNTFSATFTITMVMLIFIGIVVFIVKIPVIRRYKIENAWHEIKGGKKFALFCVSAPVIIMLLLVINEHGNNFLLRLIIEAV